MNYPWKNSDLIKAGRDWIMVLNSDPKQWRNSTPRSPEDPDMIFSVICDRLEQPTNPLLKMKSDYEYYNNLVLATKTGELRNLYCQARDCISFAISEYEISEMENPTGSSEERYHK